MSFLSGAALKGFHYRKLLKTFKQIGLTVLVGETNTGKSIACRLALSAYGMQDVGFYKSITKAKEGRVLDCSTLPFCLNDPSDPEDIRNLAMNIFEDGQRATCHSVLGCKTAPIVTANNFVVHAMKKVSG